MFKEELIIIRHARSENNIRKNEGLDRKEDCGLTEYGHRQAENLGKFLSKHMDMKGFRFFTSPFLRCLQTAAGMKKHLSVDFTVERKLREYINHSCREVTIPCRQKEYGLEDRFYWGSYESVTYKDEWNEEFINRIHDLHHALPPKSLVVTHGLPAFLLLHVATQPSTNTVPIWDHSIDNASMSYVVRGRVVWHGRNLYHEVDYDPFERPRPYDASDLLKT